MKPFRIIYKIITFELTGKVTCVDSLVRESFTYIVFADNEADARAKFLASASPVVSILTIEEI